MAFGAALLLPKLSIGQSSTDIDGVSGTGVQKKYDSNTGITSYNLNQQNFNGTDYYSTGGGSYNRDTYRSIMTFSLASIPAGSQIVEASVVYTPFRNNINISSSIKITKLNSGVPVGVTSEQWYGSIGNGTVVQNNIGNNVTTTVDVTDFVINANNSTDKNLYLGFISLSETTDYSLTAYNATLVVEYNPPPKITLENDFGSGILKADGLNISSGTIITNWAYDSNHNIEALSQTVGNIEYTFSNWTNGNDSYTSNPLTINAKSTTTWVAHFSSKKIISFYNKTESNENIANSKLFIDGSLPENEITSGDSKKLAFGSHPVKTKNETHNIQSALFKHNNWNDLKTDYKLSHSLNIDANSSNSDVAKFRTLNPAIVSLALDGVPVSAPIEIKDPWFVEPDGSQPGNWKSYSTGFTPATMPNGGVFLNELNDPGKPFYSAKISSSTATLSGSTAWFQKWTGPAGSVASPTSLETAIIFKNANDVIKANYKGQLRTGNPSNYAKNQNRMAIASVGSQLTYLVYDSMNEIWQNHQTEDSEFGLRWGGDMRLSGNTASATNPSFSNEIQVSPSDYCRWAITWVENGLIHIQLVKANRFGGGDFTYGWSAGATSLIQDDYNHIILESDLIDKYGVPLSTARPVVNLSYYPNDTAPTSLILTVAYEGKTSASATTTTIIQNELVFPLTISGSPGYISSDVSPFYTCTTWSGNRYRALTTENVSGMPVVIRYNARGSNPAKHAVYYLASTGTGTTFTKLMEYNLTTGVNTPITGLSYVRSFSSLSGNCNYTSGGIVLAAEAAIYDYYNPSNPYYDKPTVAVYVKSVSSATTPALSKTYTNYRSGVVMVDQGAVASTPVYEVNMLPVSGTQWAKATGGTSVTYIQGSNIVQPLVSGRVPAGIRKSVVIQSGSPAKFLDYSGSGVLLKGEGSAADVRAHRTVELSNGEQKEVILDFTGTRVEPVDSLEAGSVICAVQFLTESATSILVSQPDSLIFPLGVNIIRKGVSIRSYKSGLWAALSSQSFEDLQRGDILVFRSDVPVTMLINYEEFNLDGADGAGKGNIEGVSGTQLSSIKTGVAVYPNPFNPATSIAVSLESPEVVRVTVFNILGQLVTDFGKTDLGAGVHNFPFDGRLLASGTYFYRVEIGDKVKTGKLQLLK